jgi:chromosome segregation ATPase
MDQQNSELASFKEENEKLKRQIFMTNKARTVLEGKVIDAEDALERNRKETEKYRKKYEDMQKQVADAYRDMENYSLVLERLEVKVNKLEEENKALVREKDRALKEVKIVRQRYVDIVGVDQFARDFPQ